jgi:tetrahydromethanopterin S-methyltransferase subunit G
MGKFPVISLILFSFFTSDALAIPQEVGEYHATFTGRVSRLNNKASLMRVRINFKNSKYINKKDKIEFWNDSNPKSRCSSYVQARSTEYLLLKVPEYNKCIWGVHVTTGSYLHFYSPDLERSLKVARDLIDILLKKRMALEARLTRHQKRLDNYPDRVEAVNRRYDVLRKKLELEWKEELASLEEDKTFTYKNFQSTKTRLDDLEHKLEKYRIGDHNLTMDRWSLDPKLYRRK